MIIDVVASSSKMRTEVYNKLVRDKIPEIIEASGKTCSCETLEDKQYIEFLNKKLFRIKNKENRTWCRHGFSHGMIRKANVIAKAEDCVLLPQGTRHRHIWSDPSKKYTKAFGFGQALLWYAQEERAVPYLERLIGNINGYCEENWLNTFSEE